MLKYLLIAHPDGRGVASVTVCDTEAERDRATLAAIYGKAEDAGEAAPHELAELRKEGWLRFEGDPPLQWVNADCVDGEGDPLL